VSVRSGTLSRSCRSMVSYLSTGVNLLREIDMADDVERFRQALDLGVLQTIDAIRAIVAGSHPGLQEGVKWNAPSFMFGDVDLITLGLERSGGVRVVLHRGAKVKALEGFRFDDPDALARWPSPDRGVVVFRDHVDVAQRADALSNLCSRWIAATT